MEQIEGFPLATKILTHEGWKTHDEVEPGDETLGYNMQSGMGEWTVIRQVHHFPNGEIRRIGNKNWSAKVTNMHRWWSETRRNIPVPLDVHCRLCDREFISPRGYQVHMNKMHGVTRPATGRHFVGEFVPTAKLGHDHRLRLAAPAKTAGAARLSLDDVRIIAWLLGDGHIRETERPEVYDGSIFQSKPAHVLKLRALLSNIPHTETSRQRKPHHLRAHHFRLRRSYVTGLMIRSGIPRTGPELFVLRLSATQRAAWIDAIIDAEGHRMVGRVPEWREFIRIVQVDGPVQDAIRLAVFLHGSRPTFSANSAERMGYQPAGAVGMALPFIAPSMFTLNEPLGEQEVWAVETELGSCSIQQGRHVMLTGSYNAVMR